MQIQDAFGATREFVGLENFRRLFADETYIDSFKTTAIFSVLVAGFGILIALVLAVFADRVLRGVRSTRRYWCGRTQWRPRWPACSGCSCLRRRSASPYALRLIGYEWNHLLNADHAMALIVMAAVWKQISYNFLFFLAGLGIPKSLIEAAAIDGAGPWRRFWTIVFPLLSPVTFFLLVINIVYAFSRRSRSSMHRHRADRAKKPRSSFTRFTTTASRGWISAARRHSRSY